jgi:hypothetical protein
LAGLAATGWRLQSPERRLPEAVVVVVAQLMPVALAVPSAAALALLRAMATPAQPTRAAVVVEPDKAAQPQVLAVPV